MFNMFYSLMTKVKVVLLFNMIKTVYLVVAFSNTFAHL